MKVKGIEIREEDYADLDNSYGLDVESELVSILSNQLSSEIDKQIIGSLTSSQNNRVRKIKKLIEDLNLLD